MNPSQNPSALRSKKEIIDTLLMLMHQYPYSEITVKHILLESGVARKTFYRNFSSKDDVLIAYLDFMMFEYVKGISLFEETKIISIFDLILEFCDVNKEMLFILKHNGLLYLLLERWNLNLPALHGKLVQESKNSELHTQDDSMEYILAFNVGAVWNVISKWLEKDMRDSPETLKKIFFKYISNIHRMNLSDI